MLLLERKKNDCEPDEKPRGERSDFGKDEKK